MAYILRVWAIVVCLLLLHSAVSQTSQSGSLADIARQVRAQKGQSDTNSTQAQEVADELSEDQNDAGAPGGFKTYNAGDYKLWVPAPYRVDGHDDAGIVLSGPTVGVKHPVVLVGTPIATHWENNDAAFQDTATQFSRLYAQSANCEKATISDHAAYRCGLAAANLLGNQVSGTAVFVLGSGHIYPVFCVTPSDSRSRDILNDPHASYGVKEWSKKTLGREDADSRSVWQKCDTVFQSIHLTSDPSPERSVQKARPAAAADSSGMPGPAAQSNPAPTEKSFAANGTGAANAGGTGSMAGARPAAAQAAAILSSSGAQARAVPAGYKVHPFHYCSGPQQCWDASVLVPADAKLVSSDCKQYVFESKMQSTTLLLLAGLARGDCDGHGAPDLVRWKQLTDAESNRAPGTYSTIGTQVTKLDGKAATITTIAFRNGLTTWMGKRAEVESNGVPLVVGCMAPRDHFEDVDAVCSALIGSLQLP